MTHTELVEIAKQWLIHRGCSVVITEMSACSEEPDAIGWLRGKSILIECKASISDFRKDAEKTFRKYPEDGLGIDRFYMVPEQIAKQILNEIQYTNWGLIQVGEKGTKIIKESAEHISTKVSEIHLLIAAIRSIGKTAPQGIAVRYYKIESNVNRATLGVKINEQETGKDYSEKRKLIRQQEKEARAEYPTILTCGCGNKVPIRFMHRCYYCKQWFCEDCADEHFRSKN
jgi:hypothetical protein